MTPKRRLCQFGFKLASLVRHPPPARYRVLRGTFDDDDGVIGVDDDLVMGTAPLVVVSGAVVGRGDGVPVRLMWSWSG